MSVSPSDRPPDAPAERAGQAAKVAAHEEAAHEKRNWVRLTFDCNNHCVFCLDTLTHDGVMRDRDEVKTQILDGRKAGAQRLILSGGEPTMHPSFVDFIRLGRQAGYRKIQTVTNGRRFMYPGFLSRCLDAGLDEITFSLHGPNAKIHDALVGVKGAFEQESQGLKNALADGRPIVNVDIVINRGNVRHLHAMLTLFYSWGVREFDLLQVIPFGNAFREGKDILFYDLGQMRSYLLEAFEWAKRPDVHLWLNRFPPPHLEGYEHLIQDPYKLNDEVRGRQEEFARLIDEGIDLDCRDPFRCGHCYLERLCDTLYGIRADLASERFERVRLCTAEGKQEPALGGDPASAKRARLGEDPEGRAALPVLGAERKHPPLKRYPSAEALMDSCGARRMELVAPDVPSAAQALVRHPGIAEVELELGSYEGLEARLDESGAFAGRKLVRAVAKDPEQARRLFRLPGTFEVTVLLTRATEGYLRSLSPVPPRLSLRQPKYELMSGNAEMDLDLRAFFRDFREPVLVEGVPACVTGRPERPPPKTLDTAMLAPDGRLEIFRYAKRYIQDRYQSKALRCKTCAHDVACDGMHVNYVRAHGYGIMQPIGETAALPVTGGPEGTRPTAA